MKLLHVLLAALLSMLLAGCPTLPDKATEEGSVTRTTKKTDGTVETISNNSDYANYVNGQLKANEPKVVKLTCPPQGCVIGSLEVPVNAGAGELKIAPPAGPPEPVSTVIVKGFFGTIDKTLSKVGDAVPWIAGARVARDALEAASGKSVTNTSTSTTTTDSSNRSIVNDSSNRSSNTDNSNRSVNNSNNRNCQTGAPTGTTGQAGSSGPASC